MKTLKNITLHSLLLIIVGFGLSACSSDDGGGITPPTPTKELTIALDPSPVYLGAGGTATVKVRITNAEKLVSWRAVINFDPAKLSVSGLKIREVAGNLLASSGASLIESDKIVDAEAGTITLGALAQAPGFTGVSGDGTVAQFTISSPTADPTSVLQFMNADLYTYPVANPPVAKTPKKVTADVKKPS